jgi:hypothetical protein
MHLAISFAGGYIQKNASINTYKKMQVTISIPRF